MTALRRFPILLLALAAATPAQAKSTSWWDCFFREFELCQGRQNDPDSPAETAPAGKGGGGAKTYCDGKARTVCEEEDQSNTVKLGGTRPVGATGGGTQSGARGATASTIQVQNPDARRSDGGPLVPVEGMAPSGDNTVLGIDVTFPISLAADAYRSRNIRGCKQIEDAYARTLCVDAPGAGGGVIQLDYYRGRLVSLNFDASNGAGVKFKPAVSIAEEKTGTHAVLNSVMGVRSPASDLPNRECWARFGLGGGSLTLRGVNTTGVDACAPASAEGSTLGAVEWSPSRAVLREVAEQRRNDHPALRREELNHAREQLPL